MTIYHGATIESNRYGYVVFVEMQSVPVLFNDRPLFSELVARAREELHCHGDDDDGIALEFVGSPAKPSTESRTRTSPNFGKTNIMSQFAFHLIFVLL